MTSPKRHLSTITRSDAATIAELSVETAILRKIYLRAMDDWLKKRDELKEAELNAANANELRHIILESERKTG